MGNNYHVVPYKGKWAVRKEKTGRVTSTCETQKDAIQEATPLAKKSKVELVIHRRDGRIRDKDSYGKDPCPPKDKIP